MKSLLIFLAAATVPLLAAVAQTPATSPAPVSNTTPVIGATPAPSATPASSPAAGNAHDAAATVPLPGQSTGPALEKPMPLIPETAPTNPRSKRSGKSRPGASPQGYATFQTEKDIRIRIRLREAQTRALEDPALQAEWVAAHRSRTDPERRALLTTYYNHLYDRMLKIEPSLADRINLRRRGAIDRMKYPRLGDLDASENPFIAPAAGGSGPNPPSTDSTQ